MVKEENAILPAQELRSLPPELTLSAKLLAARNDRKRGVPVSYTHLTLPTMRNV